MTTYDNAGPNDPMRAVQSLLWYCANREPEWVAEQLFPGSHPDYLAAKARAAAGGLSRLWAVLDMDHRALLVRLAMDYYAEDCVAVPLGAGELYPPLMPHEEEI